MSKNKLDQDLLVLKPYLRFNVGDLVCLTSDIEKKTPMNIVGVLYGDDDYICVWLNSQKTPERKCFPDGVLVKFEVES